ncbi:hypothetical protein ACWDSJ_02525 [Nocardia sp. NPDC003482]
MNPVAPQENSAEPVDYRWTTIVTEANGRERPPRHGEGRLDQTDGYTGGTYDSHAELAASVFADICAEAVEYHRDALLDARVDGEPDPAAPVTVTTTVHDADGTVMAVLAGRLRHPSITDDDIDTAAATLGRIAVEDARLELDRLRKAVPIAADPEPTTDPDLSERLRALRAAATELRAEVDDPEYCDHRLATLEAAPDRTPDVPIDRQARVDRWRRLREISTEAYRDASRLDDAATRLRRELRPAR